MCPGVLSLPSGRKRARLETWYESVAQILECLPWSAGVCRRWARLVSELRREGLAKAVLDAMMAATVLEHDLTISTRNFSDFHKGGAQVVVPLA